MADAQEKCGQYADKYVEMEMVLVILDLILFRKQAYRHILFNRFKAEKQGLLVTVLSLLCYYV